jgi:hypothetical protein
MRRHELSDRKAQQASQQQIDADEPGSQPSCPCGFRSFVPEMQRLPPAATGPSAYARWQAELLRQAAEAATSILIARRCPKAQCPRTWRTSMPRRSVLTVRLQMADEPPPSLRGEPQYDGSTVLGVAHEQVAVVFGYFDALATVGAAATRLTPGRAA